MSENRVVASSRGINEVDEGSISLSDSYHEGIQSVQDNLDWSPQDSPKDDKKSKQSFVKLSSYENACFSSAAKSNFLRSPLTPRPKLAKSNSINLSANKSPGGTTVHSGSKASVIGLAHQSHSASKVVPMKMQKSSSGML